MISIVDQLRENGYRITWTREEIIEIFSDAGEPIGAMDILDGLAKKRKTINKTTVYREIDFLLDKEIIAEVRLSLNEKKYEIANQDHHHHLICDKCGKIQRYDDCLLGDVEKSLRTKTGFLVKDHSMEFYGICSSCN